MATASRVRTSAGPSPRSIRSRKRSAAEHPLANLPTLYAESLIEQAIEILDTIDGDADLEDGGDGEPSLACPVGGDSQIIWCAGRDDDQEQDRQAA